MLSKLVAAFCLDHNISVDVADELQIPGHTAARSSLVHNAPDYEHLLYAAQHDCILVTHNVRDFRLLHGAWQVWPRVWGLPLLPVHAGVLVPPQGRWTEAELAERVYLFVATGVPLSNTLYEWHPSKGWAHWVIQRP